MDVKAKAIDSSMRVTLDLYKSQRLLTFILR